MKTITKGLLLGLMLFAGARAEAQTKKDDIPVAELPAPVKDVLEQYVKLLRAGPNVEACAKALIPIAGGGLVNPEGTGLRQDVPRFALKKDFDNVKFYADPLEITRVNKGTTGGHGFGKSAIKGPVYKIWIAKKKGGAGMPAPISIMVPEGHPTITTPRVVVIGSL